MYVLCAKLGWSGSEEGGERDGWRERPVNVSDRVYLKCVCVCVCASHLVSSNTKRGSGVDVKAPEKRA